MAGEQSPLTVRNRNDQCLLTLHRIRGCDSSSSLAHILKSLYPDNIVDHGTENHVATEGEHGAADIEVSLAF